MVRIGLAARACGSGIGPSPSNHTSLLDHHTKTYVDSLHDNLVSTYPVQCTVYTCTVLIILLVKFGYFGHKSQLFIFFGGGPIGLPRHIHTRHICIQTANMVVSLMLPLLPYTLC